MTVLGYARVSTAEQHLDAQIEALTAAGAERVFADTLSGRSTDRPQLHAMLDYARSGDVIVVTAFDRLSRSTQDMVTLLEVFNSRGLDFRSLREALDTSTPMGRFAVHIAGAFAELERASIVDRTRAGLASARAHGKTIGRPTILTQPVIDEIHRLTDQEHLNRTQIAQRLRVSVSTVGRARAAQPSVRP